MLFNLKPRGPGRGRFHQFKRFINMVVILSVMPVVGYVIFRGIEVLVLKVTISKREGFVYVLALAYLLFIRIADTKAPSDKRIV